MRDVVVLINALTEMIAWTGIVMTNVSRCETRINTNLNKNKEYSIIN